MKSFALLCFLLLASACVFARAEEETAAEEPKTEDQPEVAADEEKPEEEAESDEEATEADEEEQDEDESTDVAEDEEKRSLICTKYKTYKHWCKSCCRPVCRVKTCTKKVCKRVHCGSYKKCHIIIKYRIVKYKVKIPYSYDSYGYGPRYHYKIKKIPIKIPVCRHFNKYCTKCHLISYVCGKKCHKVCTKKCYPIYY